MGSSRKNKTPNSSSQKRFFSSTPRDDNSLAHNGPNGNGNHHEYSGTAVKEANSGLFGRYEYEEDDSAARSLDFSKVLQDVEGSLVGTMTSSVVAITSLLSNSPSSSSGSFRVTWKELVYLVLAIVVLAGLSIFMGVAAGITISIHYFDTHGSPSFPRLEARERDLGPHQRVTTLDYSIVSSNVLNPFIGTSSHEDNAMDLALGRVITMSESGQRSVLFVVEETPPLHTDGNETRATLSAPVCRNDTGIDDGDSSEPLLGGQYKPYKHRAPPDSRFQLSASKVHPGLCSDGVTIGYDDWDILKAAVGEANALAAERFMKWNEYFASIEGSTRSSDWFDKILKGVPRPHDSTTCHHDEEDLLQYYYDEDIVFTICPGSTLKAKKGPIFINAENIQIECGDPEEFNYIRAAQKSASFPAPHSSFSWESPTCTLDAGGTHLAFGAHAKNVLVRGIVFQSAQTSSLAFHHDGAQASFEDCIWMDNAGVHGKYGAVADVNSTSNVNFYRCGIGPSLARTANSPDRGGLPMAGGDVHTMSGGPYGNGMAPGFASYLSLRN